MRPHRIALVAACLWMATASPARASDVPNTPQVIPRLAEPLQGTTSLTPALQRELTALPPSERRHRLDGLIAAHPADALARLVRALTEGVLGDDAAELRDLDAVLPATTPGSRALVLATRSETLLQLGRPEEALADAQRAVVADPEDPQAHFARAWALHLDGADDARVLRDLEAGLARDKDNGVALGRRGVLRMAQGDLEHALSDLHRAAEVAPNLPGIRVQLARALAEASQYDAARTQADEAVRLAPANSLAWLTRAQVALLLQQSDTAIASASKVLELTHDRESQADAYLAREIAWGAKGDDARMLADMASGAALEPTRSDFLEQRAIRALESSQWAAGKEAAARALAVDPQCASCLGERALAEAHLGERAGALADAEAAAASRVASTTLHLACGDALFTLGEYARAGQEFDKALALDPYSDQSRMRRAAAHEALGEHRAAIDDYTHVLDHAEPARRGAALLGRGAALYGAGEPALAIADFRTAAGVLPLDAAPRRDLGRALEASGDLVGAAQAYAQAQLLGTDDRTARRLGHVLMWLGRFADAVEPLRSQPHASQSTPDYAPLQIYVSRVRAQPADEGAARQELERSAPPHEPRLWIDSLAAFLLGHVDAATLQQRADDAPDADRAAHHCEADYEIAEVALARGQGAVARPLLQDAVRLCPATFFEAKAARAELRAQGVAID